MEKLLKKMVKKELLKKGLGKLIGMNDEKNGGGDERLEAAILLIYNTSKTRIFQVADIIERGIIQPGDNVRILDEADELSLPEKEEWDFQLGDAVTIALSRENFKWMQKQTLGWKESLNQVHGMVGIVTNLYSKYENSVGVYFPDVYTACSLYAGLLEKTERREDSTLVCRWKSGDFVKTILSSKVLQLLQRGLDQIPDDLIGKRGKVIGVAHPCVIVTFDGLKTYDLKPSSLVRCKDESPIIPPEIKHARGFEVGEKVRIISNAKKLIKNQEDKGGWSPDMSPIIGKPATVTHVQKDGTLKVQIKNFKAWRLNPDSVLRSGEEEVDEEDLKLLPGDIIKVIVTRNVRHILAMADVPSVFCEYLRATSAISCVDDDIDYYIRFNKDQNIEAHTGTFRKATTSEKEEHENIEKLVKNLKKGDKVRLDIGPPNYIQAVITELDLDPPVKMALTRSAVLIGFVNPYIAVIEFEDGLKCRVKRKLLTVPDKFHVDESEDTVSLETAGRIRDAIARSIQDIHSREGAPTEEWKLEVIFMFHGNPPCIEFKVISTVATFKAVFDWLDQNSDWKLESLRDGQFVVCCVETSGMEVKVGIIFNDEQSEFLHDISQLKDFKPEVISGSYEEGGSSKGKPEDFDTEGHRQTAEETPTVDSFNQFNYLRLYNPALAQNVYFPYVLHGQRRSPVEPIQHAPKQLDQVVHNINNSKINTLNIYQ